MTAPSNSAMVALLERVEAGDEVAAYHASRAFPVGYAHVINADKGDLNAAKALHEAVLPGWAWVVTQVGANVEGPTEFYSDSTNNPARAWLVCILRALIAQAPVTEEGK